VMTFAVVVLGGTDVLGGMVVVGTVAGAAMLVVVTGCVVEGELDDVAEAWLVTVALPKKKAATMRASTRSMTPAAA